MIRAKLEALYKEKEKIDEKIALLLELLMEEGETVQVAVNNAPQVKHEVSLPVYTKAPSLEERLGATVKIGANGERIIEEWIEGSEVYGHMDSTAIGKGHAI